MNCFRAKTRAKNIRFKRRAMRKNPGLIGLKKNKAFTIKKKKRLINKNKIFSNNFRIIREVGR